jgi:hypothetical protein
VAYLQFSRQQQASHDLLINSQVSRGFKQLGSEKVVVRLRGIYALEGVMNNSDQYYRLVLEALSAFVREGAKPPTGPPTDVQAALTVIGMRSAGTGLVNLIGANIADANLTEANLSISNLSGASPRRPEATGRGVRIGGDIAYGANPEAVLVAKFAMKLFVASRPSRSI